AQVRRGVGVLQHVFVKVVGERDAVRLGQGLQNGQLVRVLANQVLPFALNNLFIHGARPLRTGLAGKDDKKSTRQRGRVDDGRGIDLRHALVDPALGALVQLADGARALALGEHRSEERRVGKEWRSRRATARYGIENQT